MNERIAAASSSWASCPFERTNWYAPRDCQVVPICVCLNSLGGDRPGTEFNVNRFFGRGEKKRKSKQKNGRNPKAHI